MVVASGCSASSTDVVPEPLLQVVNQDGWVFMTQHRQPSAAMEALFTGQVDADEAGCLRLVSADDATVVWPVGYTLDTSGDTPAVLDADGAPVGELGDEFVLAGGEVQTLPSAMGFTDEDRERSEACPGRYWIVNDES